MFVPMMCVGILAQLRSSQGKRCQIECTGCGNGRESRGLVNITAISFMAHPHEPWDLIRCNLLISCCYTLLLVRG